MLYLSHPASGFRASMSRFWADQFQFATVDWKAEMRLLYPSIKQRQATKVLETWYNPRDITLRRMR